MPGKDEDKRVESPARQNWTKAGIAVGIGSAAIVAALLYTNRPKPDAPPGT